MAQGAYEAHVETMRERGACPTAARRSAQDPFGARPRGARRLDIDAAWLQLARNVREEARSPMPARTCRWSCACARARPGARHRARLEAIDLLFKNSGRALAEDRQPDRARVARRHAGSVHAANDTERWLAMYGKGEFGPRDQGRDDLMLHGLGYLTISTAQLDRWRELAVDVLGHGRRATARPRRALPARATTGRPARPRARRRGDAAQRRLGGCATPSG
jgi:hypothetical protein